MVLIDTNLWLHAALEELLVLELVEPGPRHWQLQRGLIGEAGTAGNLTAAAQLAALAIEHDCTLRSADNDFRRLPGLRFCDP